MSSVAHVPTQALVAAFGEDWFEVLSAASPQANFDNIIKTRKAAAPKLSPAQRAAQPFDTAKCHARVIDEQRDENGAPVYKKSGNIHPGFIDMQCRSSPTDGSCFCKRHSLNQGGNGNLGKFSDSWSALANDPKLKKDLALCYLNHHKIETLDPLGKVFPLNTLRGLVKKHYAENPSASYTEDPLQNTASSQNDDEDTANQTTQDVDQTPNDDGDDQLLQKDDDPSDTQVQQEDSDDDDDGEKHIVYEGVEYKVDGFNDVYTLKECYHMGVLTKEDPIKIDWTSKEAKFRHFESKEELDDL
jgi:hypothetical protein